MRKYIVLVAILLTFIVSTFSFAINSVKEMSLEEIQQSHIVVKYKDGRIEKKLISDFVAPNLKSFSAELNNSDVKSDVEEAILVAKGNNEVEFAEPLIIFKTTDTTPNDINVNDAWRFDITGMNKLWDEFGAIDFSGITVAVIDTGVDIQNIDLNLDTINDYDYVNSDDDADDDNGHGSHVAGVIGAIANNNTGIAGIASGVKILPIKVLNSSGLGTNDNVAAAIRYAADYGVDVINMSLSSDAESSVVRDAVAYAYGKGVILVSAAGNNSNHWANGEVPDEYHSSQSQYVNVLGYPAAFPEVLAIGSILYDHNNDDLYISDFSDVSGIRTINGVGQEVFIDGVAPGSHIYSYIDDGTVQNKSGTSMASPHVAALAAVLKAKYNQLTHVEIREIIQKTSNAEGIITPTIASYNAAIDSLEDIYGKGLINYNRAFGFDGLKFLDLKAYDLENNELIINNFSFDHLTYTYGLDVPIDTHKIVFNGESMLMGSTIKQNDIPIANIFSIEESFEMNRNNYSFEVTSEYSDLEQEINKNYFFTITREGLSEDSSLSALSVTNHTLNEVFAGDTLDYTLPNVNYETSSITVIAEKNDNNAQIEMKLNAGEYLEYISGQAISFDLIQSIDNIIRIRVTAEDFSTREYFIKVKRLSGNYLEDLVLKNTETQDYISFDPVFSKTTFDYTGSVPYSVNQVDVVYTKEDLLSVVKIDDVITESKTIDLVEGNNTVNIKVYTDGEENTKFKMYTMTITRAMASEENDLSVLGVAGHTFNEEFASDTLDYTLPEVSYETSSIIVIAEKNDNNAQIEMKLNAGEYSEYNSGDEITFDLIASSENVITIKVIAEDLSEKEYSITVRRESPSGDNDLSALSVTGQTFNEEFASDTLDYTLPDFSYETSSISITAVKNDNNAQIEMKLNAGEYSEYNSGNEITFDLIASSENVITIKVIAEDLFEKEYSITVRRESPSEDNNLSALSVTSHTLSPTFAMDTLNYTLATVNHETDSIIVTANKSDVNAQLKINGRSYETISASKTVSLSYGSNNISIEIIAENGTVKIYSITVTRESPPTNPSSGGGSTGGGGSSSGGGFFIPPPSDDDEEEIEVKPEPEDEITVIQDEVGNVTVNVEVSEEKLSEALKDSTLDFVQILGITDNEAKAVEVSINQNNLASLIASNKNIKVTFEKVEFLLNSKILESLDLEDGLIIRSEVINKDSVIISEVLKGNTISDIFELNIYDKDQQIEKNGEEIPITLTYNASSINNREKIAVFYFNNETKNWEYVGGKVIEDNKITFKAKHFSKYAVREYEKTFDDIQNHWAKNDIEILASKKITNGISENEFAPDRKITNSEFVVLLSRVLNLEETDEEIDFTDVSTKAWYIENLKSAVSSKLLTGSYNDQFYPNEPIKREDMANVLVNAYFYYTGLKENDLYITQEVKFNDEDSISQFLRNKVRISNGLGLILGDDLNHFNPNAGATRAEASTVIKRLLKLLELM